MTTAEWGKKNKLSCIKNEKWIMKYVVLIMRNEDWVLFVTGISESCILELVIHVFRDLGNENEKCWYDNDNEEWGKKIEVSCIISLSRIWRMINKEWGILYYITLLMSQHQLSYHLVMWMFFNIRSPIAEQATQDFRKQDRIGDSCIFLIW